MRMSYIYINKAQQKLTYCKHKFFKLQPVKTLVILNHSVGKQPWNNKELLI